STNSFPVGKTSSCGDSQFVSSSNLRAALSMSYCQGLNKRICCHSRILFPTVFPDSKTIKDTFLIDKWAAAASPISPAPIIATGKSKLNFICSSFSTIASDDEQQVVSPCLQFDTSFVLNDLIFSI